MPRPSARITDYGFYNRGRLQRNEAIHPMADVAMSFRIEDIHGRGLLLLQATDGRDEFIVQIDPGTEKYTVAVRTGRKYRRPFRATLPGLLRGQTIEVSLFDRQFLFAIAGRTLVNRWTWILPDRRPLPTSRWRSALKDSGSFWIIYGSTGMYTILKPPFATSGQPRARNPLASGLVSPCVLGLDEYFVLGDNSPISEDSRTWTEDRFVSHNSLVGKPFVVIFPSCEISLGGWRIQVPDLTRIRYIR